MPCPLSNRVKLQYAVTSLLIPSKAIPSDQALSMKMSPYNSTGAAFERRHIPSPFTPLIVMSDMMTNPVPPPLVTSIPSPFEESITMLSKTVFREFNTTMESFPVKAMSTFITVLHPSSVIEIPEPTLPIGQLVNRRCTIGEPNSDTASFDVGAKDFVSITIQDGIRTLHYNEGRSGGAVTE